MLLSSVAISDLGSIRSENQDNLYINGAFRRDVSDKLAFRRSNTCLTRGLYAVADGMGGEENGAAAALTAVNCLDKQEHNITSIESYLLERNAVLCGMIEENGGCRMGTTFAGLCIDGDAADIINIGDSRIYLFRDNALTQLSRDHTVIRPMLEMGILTPETARTHPARHKLSQHLGIFPEELIIEPYTAHVDLKPDDLFLLCSDGLTDELEDEEIEAILRLSAGLPETAEELFAGALRKGARDNITILLVQAEREPKN